MFPGAACLQFDIAVGDTATNLHRFDTLLAQLDCAPDTLVVLPEVWAAGFDYPQLEALARKTPLVLEHLQQRAAERTLWFAGSLPEPRDTGKPCNTLFFVGPDGVAGSYRKHHLFAFWDEDRYFQPGRDTRPMESPHGNVGALVCYDLRFPEISRDQCFAGARVLVVSAQWPMARLDHWQQLLRARAVENQVFVAACNGCGDSPFGELAGHSMIVAPDGTILAAAGPGPQAMTAGFDIRALEALRSRFCPPGERPWSGRDRDKLLAVEALEDRLTDFRRRNSRVVFTNGCFDILHAGHVSYLEKARCQGDFLVVALNSDRSVRALKGPSRPVNSEQERARVLAALGCVDAVGIFDEDTPQALIARLLPDVLVKGADWAEDEIAGAAEVKAAGGRVERIVFEHGTSTSAVIEKIRSQG
jgi:rfaE bifunctional protein nucleotidyltransferase chain/domain